MINDGLSISLLTLAGIRLTGMLVFVHLFSQKREGKYILLMAGWFCMMAGSVWGLYTHVVSGAMDHYFSSLLAALGTAWIIFGALLYFGVVTWRHIHVGSLVILAYGALPLAGFHPGPSPGVIVQVLISLGLTFIVIFKRRTFIGFTRSSYFWLVLLAILSDALTLAFAINIINSENMAIGFAGTSLIIVVAIVFFLHLEYNISTRSQKISEEKYRSMITNLIEGFYSVSFEGVLLDYNNEFTRILDLDPQKDHRGVMLPIFWQNQTDRKAYQEELVESGVVRNYEISARTATGKAITVMTSARLVKSEHNNPIKIEGSFLDITDRKLAVDELNKLKSSLEETVEERTTELREKVEKLNNSQKAMLYMVEDLNKLTEQLQEEQNKLMLSNKELEAFSYSVSHDLRAPLRHINGYVDLLNENFRADLPEKAQYYLDTVTGAARQMGALIDELLQFSRTGRQELRKSKTEMNALLKEVIDGIHNELNERDIAIHVQDLPQVFGDYSMLKQVCINLVDNAVKYTRNTKKAEISIGSREEEKEFVFYIKDNGVGFDMKYAHKLFGVFQRLHSQSEFEGTGIGLANVHRIIHKHNGRVWAEAEPGKGATFFFSLPKSKE